MSGRGAGGDTDGVLELLGWDAVLVGDDVEGFTSAEQGEGVLETGTTPGEDRLPEPAVGSTTSSAVS